MATETSFYIANIYVMDDSLQKIVAASHPFLHAFYYVMGVFTPEDAGRRKDIYNMISEPSGSAAPAQRAENADMIQITQLKHPRYSTMAVRMSSFRSWPNYLNQTARQMAYAGFFHPGIYPLFLYPSS